MQTDGWINGWIFGWMEGGCLNEPMRKFAIKYGLLCIVTGVFRWKGGRTVIHTDRWITGWKFGWMEGGRLSERADEEICNKIRALVYCDRSIQMEEIAKS